MKLASSLDLLTWIVMIIFFNLLYNNPLYPTLILRCWLDSPSLLDLKGESDLTIKKKTSIYLLLILKKWTFYLPYKFCDWTLKQPSQIGISKKSFFVVNSGFLDGQFGGIKRSLKSWEMQNNYKEHIVNFFAIYDGEKYRWKRMLWKKVDENFWFGKTILQFMIGRIEFLNNFIMMNVLCF